MKLNHTALSILNFVVAGLVVAVDRLTKYIFLSQKEGGLAWQSDFFSIQLRTSFNSNFAFSIPSPRILVLAVVVLVFLAVVWFWIKQIKNGDQQSIWLGFIVGGAIGNIVDRFLYQGVVDWIELSFFNVTWSSFNLADTAIVIGVVGWIASVYWQGRRK